MQVSIEDCSLNRYYKNFDSEGWSVKGETQKNKILKIIIGPEMQKQDYKASSLSILKLIALATLS